MRFDEFIKPYFLRDEGREDYAKWFNYRRTWLAVIVLLALCTLTPLATMALIDYQVTRDSVESEGRLRTSRIVSNTKRVVASLLAERISAMRFVLREMSYEDLVDVDRLETLLGNLKDSHGGFLDLSVINLDGVQTAYAGPFNLTGRNYSGQHWFDEAVTKGAYVSGVFLGYRNVPHLVIALRHTTANGGYVLRATLDTDRFNKLAELDLMEGADSFIINRQGVLQTPSLHHGDVLSKLDMPIPEYSERTRVLERGLGRNRLLIGYAYIPDSPFILIVVKPYFQLMSTWYETRIQLIEFMTVSVGLILLAVVSMATFLVNRVYFADQNRAAALHHAEHANKMASIGRLAAGVAHEINNPLAVIGEKAGLMTDLLTYRPDNIDSGRMMGIAKEIADSVERCGKITKHLLGFARHISVSLETINISAVIHEVLGFLNKEAEYRGIDINVDVMQGLPDFECDRGKLQQILLNLINNAFQAVSKNGHVAITATQADDKHIQVQVADNGCGIGEQDRKRIFEPFYSTKLNSGGTGLGLSITYGLVRKLGGEIAVDSQVGEGTVFTIILPLQVPQPRGEK